MTARPEGITHPSIDDLLATTESKYSLVIYGARRARQITGYYSQVGEYALEYVGPLVEAHLHEKPLSIALREIHDGLLVAEAEDPTEVAARAQTEAAAAAAVEAAAIEAATLDPEEPAAMGDAEGDAEVVDFPPKDAG